MRTFLWPIARLFAFLSVISAEGAEEFRGARVATVFKRDQGGVVQVLSPGLYSERAESPRR
jgi:hypothetical protein